MSNEQLRDQELRDKMASAGHYNDGPGHYEGAAFRAGWDAARANLPPEVEALVAAAERACEYVKLPYLEEALAPFRKGVE